MIEARIGDILLYRLNEQDIKAINRRRTSGAAIQARMQAQPLAWPEGAQAHIGFPARPGQVFPLIVTTLTVGGLVNGQVMLDGNDTLWVTSVGQGTCEGTWSPKPK